MSSICFTGKGMSGGTLVTRDIWSARAEARGFNIHDKVHPHTDYLVASRSDTTKAAAARRNGTTVISYAQFEQLLAGQAIRSKFDAGAPPPDPAKLREALKEALDQASVEIEGWGSF